jgi:5-methylthioadenosine/S-adenosylhomocysteine deaminase
MFQVMKITALIHKHHRWDPLVTPAQTVLDLATCGGASCLQFEGGSLAEGKLADVILLDLQHPNLIPHHNYSSLLVYSAQGGNVSTTIVNGRPLMVDREFVACDYHQIAGEAQKAAGELIGDK